MIARRDAGGLLWVRVLCGLLVLQGTLGAALKLIEGRTGDLAHNGLHLASGLLGLAMASGAGARRGAQRFALGFGVFYSSLAAVGLLGGDPPGLPMGVGDHIFHTVIGVSTLAVGLLSDRGR